MRVFKPKENFSKLPERENLEQSRVSFLCSTLINDVLAENEISAERKTGEILIRQLLQINIRNCTRGHVLPISKSIFVKQGYFFPFIQRRREGSLKQLEKLSGGAETSVLFFFWVVPRPARIAELPRSKFDPELFPHSAYVEIFVTFATKVPNLTFCNKM